MKEAEPASKMPCLFYQNGVGYRLSCRFYTYFCLCLCVGTFTAWRGIGDDRDGWIRSASMQENKNAILCMIKVDGDRICEIDVYVLISRWLRSSTRSLCWRNMWCWNCVKKARMTISWSQGVQGLIIRLSKSINMWRQSSWWMEV
jgi:hypothetical protein